MELAIVLRQLFVLFSLVGVGFTLRRLKVFDQAANSVLSNLVLRVALPATIVMGITGATGVRETSYLFYVIGLSIAVYAVLGTIAVVSSRVVRAESSEEQGALANISMFGNIAFLGIPLTIALFGAENVFYAILFNLMSNVFAFSVGIKLLGGSKAKFSIKSIFNTLMNIALSAMLLFILGIEIPEIVQLPLGHLRNMLTP
ncbi:MAG: AEC family transporter, partial [Oscillospiraceae bacterium]|nr:AEC family transporter [Oscillospiraceae bacterium]